jgi:hypothetical protein
LKADVSREGLRASGAGELGADPWPDDVELLRVVMLPDHDRARRIGDYWLDRDRERSPSC